MFVRRKHNKSGSTSIQAVAKINGKYRPSKPELRKLQKIAPELGWLRGDFYFQKFVTFSEI
jgi:hypothetical protein